jgi:hypothetical protein
MSKETFEKRIEKILESMKDDLGQLPRDNIKRRLRELCAIMQVELAKDNRDIVVSLQPGFEANMGQQINVVVEIPHRKYRDTLFRVYIPVDGYPIQLDFYGEEPQSADTLEDMENAIASFLDKAEMKSRMVDYRYLAMLR